MALYQRYMDTTLEETWVWLKQIDIVHTLYEGMIPIPF